MSVLELIKVINYIYLIFVKEKLYKLNLLKRSNKTFYFVKPIFLFVCQREVVKLIYLFFC